MFQSFSERVVGHDRGADLRRWLVVGLVGAIVAAGLVALGRWTAPSAAPTAQQSAASSQATGAGQPSIATAVMSPRKVQQAIERFYSGNPLPGTMGVIDPAVMPSLEVQQALELFYNATPLPGTIDPAQTLERFYSGTPFPGTMGTIDPAVMPSLEVQQVLEHFYLGIPLPRNASK